MTEQKTIDSRLSRLEKQNRWLKAMASLFMAMICVSVLMGQASPNRFEGTPFQPVDPGQALKAAAEASRKFAQARKAKAEAALLEAQARKANAEAERLAKTVVAEKFVLVDSKKKIRGVWQATPKGSVLAIYSTKQVTVAELANMGDVARLAFWNNDGKYLGSALLGTGEKRK